MKSLTIYYLETHYVLDIDMKRKQECYFLAKEIFITYFPRKQNKDIYFVFQ